MIIKKYESREEWLAGRIGCITGTKFKDILVKRGTGKKVGFFQLIADKLGIPADDENPMARGTRLEKEAIEEFVKQTGKKVNTDLVIFAREDNPDIAYSPDGYTDDMTESIEVKCLSSARHIETLLSQKIPDEYTEQSLQPFIVNDRLQTLYFILYDPRLLAKPFFYLTLHRESVAKEVEEYIDYQKNVLAEVEKIVLELSNF